LQTDQPGGLAATLRLLLARPPLLGDALEAYRRERTWSISANVAFAVTGGGFAAVVADKAWGAHPLLIAAITAAPMVSNLAGTPWSKLAHGRPKVPFLAGLTAMSVLATGSIALAPPDARGSAVLLAAVLLANLMLSGVIALRSTVWSLNYEREVRARVTARFNLITTAVIVLASLIGSLLLDWRVESFRWIYAVSAGIAITGVFAIARVPVLGEREQLALEHDIGESKRAGQLGMWRLLRADPDYARYLGWQFVLGVSNMMTEAPLVYLVSHQLQASYAVSIGLVTVVPMALATVTLPLWAHYLDRVHIVEFRTRQAALWIVSQGLTCLGAFQGSLEIIAVARIILGLARGGGSLAWNLGHNDFAGQRDLAAYMGLHVTLTGLRGLFAPFLGIVLLVGTSAHTIPGTGLTLPAFAGIGSATFAISTALSTVAGIGFLRLWRRMRASRA